MNSPLIMAAAPENDCLRYVLLRSSSLPPTPTSEGAAGFDLHADLGEGLASSGQVLVIPPGEKAFIGTGVSLMLPSGTYGHVAARSGLALEFGVHVLGGLIVPDYRGEVKITLVNSSDKPFAIRQGDHVAQLLLENLPNFDSLRILSIGGTPRGASGFSSLGRWSRRFSFRAVYVNPWLRLLSFPFVHLFSFSSVVQYVLLLDARCPGGVRERIQVRRLSPDARRPLPVQRLYQRLLLRLYLHLLRNVRHRFLSTLQVILCFGCFEMNWSGTVAISFI